MGYLEGVGDGEREGSREGMGEGLGESLGEGEGEGLGVGLRLADGLGQFGCCLHRSKAILYKALTVWQLLMPRLITEEYWSAQVNFAY